jgi:hypothetical protein
MNVLDLNELLHRDDGSSLMSVIAGNRIDLHNYLVDADAKGIVANTLRESRGGAHVFAFGDSMLDLAMLQASDRAYVVYTSSSTARGILASPSTFARVHQLVADKFSMLAPHTGIQIGSFELLREEIVKSEFNRMRNYTSDLAAQILAIASRCADLMGYKGYGVYGRVVELANVGDCTLLL